MREVWNPGKTLTGCPHPGRGQSSEDSASASTLSSSFSGTLAREIFHECGNVKRISGHDAERGRMAGLPRLISGEPGRDLRWPTSLAILWRCEAYVWRLSCIAPAGQLFRVGLGDLIPFTELDWSCSSTFLLICATRLASEERPFSSDSHNWSTCKFCRKVSTSARGERLIFFWIAAGPRYHELQGTTKIVRNLCMAIGGHWSRWGTNHTDVPDSSLRPNPNPGEGGPKKLGLIHPPLPQT